MKDFQKPNVLVVDDDEVHCIALVTILKHFGCQSRCATTGEKCLCLVNDIIPDVVFLDLQLPRLTGTQVLNKLHQSGMTRIWAYAMTASGPANENSLQEKGFKGLLEKPVSVSIAERIIHDWGVSKAFLRE